LDFGVAGVSLGTIVIFVVEDELMTQEVLQLALEEGGFAVSAASSGDQAMAMLEAQSPEFRALITDVNLSPGKLTGWDVARRARELNPDLPVVYMTGGSAHEWSSMGVPNSVLLMMSMAVRKRVNLARGKNLAQTLP